MDSGYGVLAGCDGAGFVVVERDEQLCGADAVAYADEGTRHLRAEVVYHVEEISGVVGPGCWGFVSLV